MPELLISTEPDLEDRTATSPPNPPTVHREPPAGEGGGNQLTRTTVNLTPRAVAALDRMAGPGRNGPTKTELINRGIQILEVVEQILDRNGRLTIKHNDGTEQTIYFVS